MAIGTRIGPDGRPIDESFFGGGLGQQLASLPGTPVLPGASGGGAAPGGYETPGALPPLAGGTPQTNPGTPPPNAPAGTSNFFGDTSPFQTGVTGTVNNTPVPFDSRRYVTPQAAQQLGNTFGANVVEQNLSNMASPGSGAPSAPQLGLDFGGGRDIQDASMGAWQLARGDRPEDVAARYQAGLRNTGWGGPAPTVSRADENGFWNTSSPISTNTPTAEQSSFFGPGPDAGAGVYAANKAGQGNYGLSSGSGADQAQLIAWLRSQLGQ